MFSSQSAPSLLFFVGLFFVAESPRWLIRKGQISEVEGVLTRIGGTDYARQESGIVRGSFAQETGTAPADRPPENRYGICFGKTSGLLCSSVSW